MRRSCCKIDDGKADDALRSFLTSRFRSFGNGFSVVSSRFHSPLLKRRIVIRHGRESPKPPLLNPTARSDNVALHRIAGSDATSDVNEEEAAEIGGKSRCSLINWIAVLMYREINGTRF